MAIAQLAQRGQEAGGRDVIAALTLDRLDEDGGDLLWRGDALEDGLLDLGDTGAASIDLVAGLAAARVGDMMNVRHQRREAAAMNELRAGQRHGAVGAAVEGAEEGDSARAARVPARQLQRRLEGLGAAVGEEDTPPARPQLAEPFGEVDLR